MAAQKQKKKLLTEIFGIFYHLITQNPTNQDSQLSWFLQTIWKTVRRSKNMGLQGIISAWKWLQNLLQSKFLKMAEKRKFRALSLFEVHIQQRWYLTQETLSGVLLEDRKLKIKKSIMAAQKCKNILFQAALKDFWSSANQKIKKLHLSKLSLL